MRKKVLWITETALMLALLVALQAVTKPLGQLVTGSCVNGVLAIAALLVGMSSGITVALLSPVFAFLFGIAPNIVTVKLIFLLGYLRRKRSQSRAATQPEPAAAIA